MDPGTVIDDRFEIERPVKAGATGEVHRARDRGTGAPVALKVLHAAQSVDRFAREAEVLAQLAHPGIVRYVAHGATAAGALWLAMEWLEGEDLGARLARAPLSVPEVGVLAARVAEALAASHARGVVHRDIKPSNLFLERGEVERAKLIDFGIALRSSALRTTRVGLPLGTPGYMAPEQARGAATIDARADVFALGCVLFECLTGRPAFAGVPPLAALARGLLEQAPRVRDVAPAVPPGLADLVDRMLAKEADRRPRDGSAIVLEIAGLRAALAPSSGRQRMRSAPELPPAAPPPSVRPRLPSTPEIVVPESHRAAPGAAAAARAPVISTLRDTEVAPSEEIAGPRSERAPQEATRMLLGKPTPCLGRQAELDTLRARFDACLAGPAARALLIVAPAGAGKSRLRQELALRLGGRAQIWLGGADPRGAAPSFGVLGAALRQALGIRDGDPKEARLGKLRARVGRHVLPEHRARVAEFLGELVSAPTDAPSPQLRAARRESVLMGDQLRRAFEEFLAAECAARPVVLALENMHLADRPSVRFLDEALRALHDKPLFVLALARPEIDEVFPKLFADRDLERMQLGPLPREACDQLVHRALGPGLAAGTARRLVERAAGNPLYLEELIREVAAGGDVPPADDEAAAPPSTIGLVPASAHGAALPGAAWTVVRTRLGSLDPVALEVLRAGSVFGATFQRGGVLAVLGEAREAAARAALDALLARELLVARGERKQDGDPAYAFSHDLLREAASGMLEGAERARAHRLAAAWLERAGDVDALVLADHFERGGEPERAVRWYGLAADQALDANDLEAALARAQRGVDCALSGARGGEGSDRLRASSLDSSRQGVGLGRGAALAPSRDPLGALRLTQAVAHRWLGHNEEALRVARDAMRLLPRGSDGWLAAVGELAVAAVRLGDHAPIEVAGHVLCELLDDRGPEPEIAGAASRVATQMLYAGRTDLADALFERLADLAPAVAASDPGVAARVLQARGVRALFAGDLEGHVRLMEQAAARFDEAGDARNACSQRANLTFARMELGAYDEVEGPIRDALAAAERLGLLPLAALSRCNLGVVLAQKGALDDARAVAQQAVEAFAAQGDRRMQGTSRINLALILLRAGDLPAAAREAQAAVDLLAAIAPSRAYALAVLARMDLARGARREALAHATQAIGMLIALGGIEEGESAIRLAHAEALAANGERAAARDAIRAASARLRERAARIADPALRKSYLERVPDNARTLELARAWCPPEG